MADKLEREMKMSTETDAAIAAFIQKTTGAITSSTDFVSAQLPEVIQQFLAWRATISIAMFTSFLIMSLLTGRTARRFYVEGRKQKTNSLDGDGIFIGAFAFGFGCVFCVALTLANLDWLYIIIAPKAYLIEYAAKLLR